MRPDGPLKIRKTKMLTKDVMVAKLCGASEVTVAAVRHKGKFHFVAPESLGGPVQDVPADTLTDCMNWSVTVLGEELKERNKKTRRK